MARFLQANKSHFCSVTFEELTIESLIEDCDTSAISATTLNVCRSNWSEKTTSKHKSLLQSLSRLRLREVVFSSHQSWAIFCEAHEGANLSEISISDCLIADRPLRIDLLAQAAPSVMTIKSTAIGCYDWASFCRHFTQFSRCERITISDTLEWRELLLQLRDTKVIEFLW